MCPSWESCEDSKQWWALTPHPSASWSAPCTPHAECSEDAGLHLFSWCCNWELHSQWIPESQDMLCLWKYSYRSGMVVIVKASLLAFFSGSFLRHRKTLCVCVCVNSLCTWLLFHLSLTSPVRDVQSNHGHYHKFLCYWLNCIAPKVTCWCLHLSTCGVWLHLEIRS